MSSDGLAAVALLGCVAIMVALFAVLMVKSSREKRRVRNLRAEGTSVMARLHHIEPVMARNYRMYQLTLRWLSRAGNPS